MCGICGFFTQKPVSDETLKSMTNFLAHRGPDDAGTEILYTSSHYCLGFGHRRLSILDLSQQGHQPMHSADQSIHIVYNGEIYNFRELRKEIDYPFVSQCDTEVLIAAYQKWGVDCLKHLNGMFAFALYDKKKDLLFIARDRIGKKPLYYYQRANDFVFASELKSIMAFPRFEKQIRHDILSRFLYQGYIAAPDTIFEHTYKLQPGHYMLISEGKAEISCYWDSTETFHNYSRTMETDYETAKQTLHNKLKHAVQLRMISDVPLGVLLSGGYDSSLVLALAQSQSSQPLQSFSIGFREKEFDEAIYAANIARHLGSTHHELYISEEEMLQMIDQLSFYYDEPFADSSQIPSMLVSKLAKRSVSVALSGDGGDEFFCGYSIYDILPTAQKLDWAGAAAYRITNGPIIKNLDLLDKMPFSIKAIVKNRDKNTKTQLGGFYYQELCRDLVGRGINEQYPIELRFHEANWQKRRMLLDINTYLPDDILVKVDRASMRYALEMRSPLLDADVIEYSFRLPHNFKYKRGNKKRILKDIAHQYVPKELLDRPKSGFSVPIAKWLQTTLKDQLLAYSRHDFLKQQGLFHPQKTERLIHDFFINGDSGFHSGKNFSKIVWAFFVFQQWHNYTFK